MYYPILCTIIMLLVIHMDQLGKLMEKKVLGEEDEGIDNLLRGIWISQSASDCVYDS